MIIPAQSLYIHWPFCLSKCPYCDFNSHVAKVQNYDEWFCAYERIMLHHKENFVTDKLKTIFFGGGTPSLMPTDLVEKILQTAEKIFGFESDIEITLEANPTSSEAEKFKGYRKAGVNRLSMGIQSLNDADLRKLGRTHSALEAMNALTEAKKIFENISFDLIYARENQTLGAWREELTQALSLEPTHISLYQLTIEEGTMFSHWYKRGKITIPNDETAEELYFFTSDFLEENGFEHYEISNFAKQGREAKHNLAYWKYQPYMGIGAGAHGRIFDNSGKFYATYSEKMPEAWKNILLNNEEKNWLTLEEVPLEEQKIEFALMGLRLKEGIDKNRYDIKWNLDKIAYYNSLGLLEEQGNILHLTKKGRPVMNGILADIF